MTMRVSLLLFVCAVAGFPAGAQKKEKNQPPAEFKVGMTSRVFHPKAQRNWRGAQHQELRVTVWYPAAENAVETQQVIGAPDAPLFLAGKAAEHAAMAPALDERPLIVLSHGTGGSAMQMAWLGTALARAGYIAAAVNHPGNNALEPYTAEGFVLWWERATDLSEVIDGMLADPEFGPKIDKDRIGAAGFSIGGYTVLALGGARADISVIIDLCKQQPDTPVCHVPEMKEMGTPEQMLAAVRKTSGVSLARSDESYLDPRVHAISGDRASRGDDADARESAFDEGAGVHRRWLGRPDCNAEGQCRSDSLAHAPSERDRAAERRALHLSGHVHG